MARNCFSPAIDAATFDAEVDFSVFYRSFTADGAFHRWADRSLLLGCLSDSAGMATFSLLAFNRHWVKASPGNRVSPSALSILDPA